MVISYQQGKVSYESISGYISLYVYDYPRRTKRWDQDRCSDFFVFVHHRLKKMADSFVFSGLPFEAYLNVSLKHQMNSFLKKRREKELKEEVFCRMCATGSLDDESSLYKIHDTFDYEIKEPVAAYKKKTGLGRAKQRLFFLALSDPDRLDDGGMQDEICVEVKSPQGGYVSSLDALSIGTASQHIGAGRLKKDDVIDLSAGVVLLKKCGEYAEEGEVIAKLYGKDEDKVSKAAEEVLDAYGFTESCPEDRTLIKAVLGI